MQINGFQKMTVLDFPERIACTVFTAGCNLRCPFCHNARLVTHTVKEDTIPTDEVLAFLKKRTGLLDGVCITGGEPLLQHDITDFIKEVKALGFALKLDTNGCFPDKLKSLVNSGLIDYVAMDIKNSPDMYAKTVGVSDFDISAVEESKNFLLSGAVDYEFRTTVVRELHTAESMRALAEWIAGAKRYYLQGFVDSGDLIGDGFSAHSREFMEQLQADIAPFVQKVEIRGL